MLNLSGNFLCLPCMSEMELYFPLDFFFGWVYIYEEVHGMILRFCLIFISDIVIHVHIFIIFRVRDLSRNF